MILKEAIEEKQAETARVVKAFGFDGEGAAEI